VCLAEYLGGAYAGFQRQPGKVTVQGVLEEAIERVTGERSVITGSGRTDAGAHALGQVVAFSTGSSLPAERLRKAINTHLPADIRLISAGEAAPAFHPRFDAVSRRYRYLIWNRGTASPFWVGRAALVRPHLDEREMHRAAQALLGEHDFGAFVASTAVGSRVRTMYVADVRREGDLVIVELEANGFMQQMVRSIVGTLIRVGSGKIPADALSSILSAKDRSMAGTTAPAQGLYLVDVRYPAAPSAAATQETFEETE
jgi:tRNA pseudouridine38-40 synthase